jgi:hypothetical protein
MHNPFDILRTKEQELLKVKRETEALRLTAHLLSDVVPIIKARRQEVSPIDFDVLESKLDALDS